MSESAFTRRTSLLLVVLCVGSFLAALGFTIFGPSFDTITSHESNAYSYSAVGHRAFVEVLEALDIPVVVSRHRSAWKAGSEGVLIVIEPGRQGTEEHPGAFFDHEVATDLQTKCAKAGATLLVLPKWRVSEDAQREGWCDASYLRKIQDADRVLKAVGAEGRTVRVQDGRTMGDWRRGPLDVTPDLPYPQLIKAADDELEPLVACDAGLLVGEMRYEGRQVVIVSDPDVFANHSLGRGANALLAVELVEYLRGDGAAVVDETTHGFLVEPSIWRALFRFPLVLLPLTAGLVLIVLLWTGMGRFGSPQTAPPPLEPGNRFLIQNTADLLRLGGDAGHVLRRYLRATALGVSRTLHAPPSLRGPELTHWLERMEQVRGVRTTYGQLQKDTQRSAAHATGGDARVVDVAMRIRQWKREILHGPAGPSNGTH